MKIKYYLPKKTSIVTAIEWDGTNTGRLFIIDNIPYLKNKEAILSPIIESQMALRLPIATLIINKGDFIVTGNNAIYPCYAWSKEEFNDKFKEVDLISFKKQ